jgi:hypothetical protein
MHFPSELKGQNLLRFGFPSFLLLVRRKLVKAVTC